MQDRELPVEVELAYESILIGVCERLTFDDCEVYLRGYDFLLEVAEALFDELAELGFDRAPHAGRSVAQVLAGRSCSDAELRQAFSFLLARLGFYTVSLAGPYSDVPAVLTTPQEFHSLPLPAAQIRDQLQQGRLLALPVTVSDLENSLFEEVLERGWAFLNRPGFVVQAGAYRRQAPTARPERAAQVEQSRRMEFRHPANVLLNLDHPDAVVGPVASESEFFVGLLDDETNRVFDADLGGINVHLPMSDTVQLYLTLGAKRYSWAGRDFEAPLYLLPVYEEEDGLRAENSSAFLNPALYLAGLSKAITGEQLPMHLDPLRPMQDVRTLMRDEPTMVERFGLVSADVSGALGALSDRMWISMHPTSTMREADPLGAGTVVDLVSAGVNLIYIDNNPASRLARIVDVAAECELDEVLTYLVAPMGSARAELGSMLGEHQVLDCIDVDDEPVDALCSIAYRTVEAEGRVEGFENFYYALESSEFTFHEISLLFRKPLTYYCKLFYGSLDKLFTEFYFPFSRILVHEAHAFPPHKLCGARFDTQVYYSFSDDAVVDPTAWQRASDFHLDLRSFLEIDTISRISR